MLKFVIQPCVKRDGRKVSRAALEELRLMVIDRMNEGEAPAQVAESCGLHRGWAYKVRAKAKGRGHGKRALLSRTPVVERPGQRQSISAASAINSKGAFWFETYQGALTGELFVQLLKNMMAERERPVHLIVDGLPAHKKAAVKEYAANTEGRLTLHFLPGYAPDPNPDELVWSYAKRTGAARSPLRKGEKLKDHVDAQLQSMADDPSLVRSFFGHPSVAYIADC